MTAVEQQALAKSFEMRRAGLLAADEVGDAQFLDLLRVVVRDEWGRFLPARVLTPSEKEAHREGRLRGQIRGEIVTEAVARELEHQRTAKARAAATMKATKAAAEARRAAAEVQRFG